MCNISTPLNTVGMGGVDPLNGPDLFCVKDKLLTHKKLKPFKKYIKDKLKL